MTERSAEKKLLQWHQAFYAGLQIELEEEAHKLIFENEHQLGNKPMEIDVLIIKKDTDEPIRKNIGRIFRKHNIIEYKSPEDYISIDDFYKVYGYCWFYKADVPNVNTIKEDELTITFVSHSYPREVLKHLMQRREYKVEAIEKGIYHVQGDVVPIQFVVTKDLDKEENLWLKSLTDKLEKQDVLGGLLDSYKENYKNPLYKSMMNIIIRANQDVFEEVRDMCEALEELMKDKIEKIVNARVEEQVEAKVKEQVDLAEMRIAKLMAMLSEAGRTADIVEAARDKSYQKKLLEEYGI